MTDFVVRRMAPALTSHATSVIHENAERSVQVASEITVAEDQLKSERFTATAHQYVDISRARLRQHGKAVQAFSDLKNSRNEEGSPPSFHAGKFVALQEELAAVALSDITDRSREDAARQDLFRLAGELGLASESMVASSGTDVESPILLLSEDLGSQNLGDVWEQLADAIGKLQQNDVTPRGDALDRYTKLYEEITAVLGKLDAWMRADGDDKMTVDFKDLETALKNILKQYDGGDYKPDKMIANGLSKEDADALCEKLGLSKDSCVFPGTDGKYCVRPDISKLKELINNLPPKDGNRENNYSIPLGTFNIWKSGFEAQIRRIEDAMQAVGEKYTQSYSRFENFHKTISSIVQSMVDMLKQYLQF